MNALLSAHNLACGHGKAPVLEAVDLTLAPGEMVGLLGVNGSGKSTLLMTLSGALEPMAGNVGLAGRDATALTRRERARAAALLAQRSDMVFALSCFEVALMGRYAHLPMLGGYCARDREITTQAMAETGSLHLAARPIDQVSGGELARVLLARTLVQEAPVLLLDEPCSHLDPAASIMVLDLVRNRCSQGSAALMAMHDINLAALYCDRLMFLSQGRVAVLGPTKDVLDEQTLRRIYGADLTVIRHPRTGAPQVLAVPGGARPDARGPGNGADHGTGSGAGRG